MNEYTASDRIVTPRRVWIPWGSHLYTYPTTQQLALYTDDPQSGEARADPGADHR